MQLVFWAMFIAIMSLNLNGFAQTHNDPEAIADLRVATGQNDIVSAWLILPTDRYAHFVQGSLYEPSGLRVKMRDGRTLTLVLGAENVFEDRQPRLADLDGDGHDEIILVLSSFKKGASLAAYSIVGDMIVLKAKTPYIGRPYRWLNPAGIADFDGDGRLDVAFVAMPHLVKRLEFWTLSDGAFEKIGEADGFSNHKNGSLHTGMAVVADFDGNGIMDLALPVHNRLSIRAVGFAGRAFKSLKRFSLPSPANGQFSLQRTDAAFRIFVPLEDGTVAEILL